MAKVYLETSMISALVADRQDVVSSYRRKASREWNSEIVTPDLLWEYEDESG